MTAHVLLNYSKEWKKGGKVCRIVNHLFIKSLIVIIMKEYIC